MSNENFGNVLEDEKQSLTNKMNTLWQIRQMQDKEKAVKELERGLVNKSVLFRHELCYLLGQIGDSSALPILQKLLENETEDCMVRHEAAEAIGAIGLNESINYLKKFEKDPVREVRETVELAIKRIEKNKREECQSGEFHSIDPTPPKKNKSTKELINILLDTKESLYKRYKAMFALRNKSQEGDEEALQGLCSSFKKDEGALFKHEVAFVLGQLQKKQSMKVLIEILKDETEHPMVRHEAAEALGSLSEKESLEILNDFVHDKEEAVSDSCVVAIDIHNYWKDWKNE